MVDLQGLTIEMDERLVGLIRYLADAVRAQSEAACCYLVRIRTSVTNLGAFGTARLQLLVLEDGQLSLVDPWALLMGRRLYGEDECIRQEFPPRFCTVTDVNQTAAAIHAYRNGPRFGRWDNDGSSKPITVEQMKGEVSTLLPAGCELDISPI